MFADGKCARELPAGTVPRGGARDPLAVFDPASDRLPMPVTMELLARGRERFDIYCAPCHDRSGSGRGMIVRRGYTAPPSLHDERLRTAPAGHFVDVMTGGWGAMPPYAAQVPAADRWAIAAYIRALQRSQHATLADVAPEAGAELEAGDRP
jgi:mono/diheme cytochrome c family protein